MPRPVIFTPPPRVQCRHRGFSRKWDKPRHAPQAMATAASYASETACGLSRGPSASMSSSESAATHSSTT